MKQNNIYKFDYSWAMQEKVCDKRLDEHDYIGALQAAKYSRSGKPCQREKKIAEVYAEMQLYDLAAHHYFKFLDLADKSEQYSAYEGLGLCYLNAGDITLAQYYLNMSVLSSGENINVDADMLDYVRDLAEDERTNFKIVHPPELADYTDLLNESKKLLQDRKYDEALELLGTVDERSKFYTEAANDKVVGYLLKEDYKNAEKEALKVLKLNPDDITALAGLQSVYLQTGRRDEAVKIAERLYCVKTDNLDDLYKTASVLCEQDMPRQALEKYKQIEREAPFDLDILFTIAALYNNIGHLYDAVKYLRQIVDIYGDAGAKYYLNKVNKNLFEGRDVSRIEHMPYVLRLPPEEKKRMLGVISAISRMKSAELNKFGLTGTVCDAFDWCLSNDEIKDPVLEVMTVNAISAVHKGAREYIADLFLNPGITDSVKFELMGRLCEKNYEGEFGIVMSGIYKKVRFYAVAIGKASRTVFLKAYGLCFSKFVMLSETYAEKLKDAAELLYYVLSANGALKKPDYKTLAAAIYLASGIKDAGRSIKKMYDVFGADTKLLKSVVSQFKEYKA